MEGIAVDKSKNKKKETPALLQLLNERSTWNLPPWRAPLIDDARGRLIETAARTAQKAEPSDPFMYRRMKHQLTLGYDDPNEVMKAAQTRIRVHQ